MRIILAFFTVIAAVAACDGGGGSTGTSSGSSSGGSSSGASQEPAGSAGQEDAYCEAVASHQKCAGATSTPQPCEEDGKCIYGRLMSRTAANAYFSCYSSPSCKGDDECAEEAGRAAGGDAADRYATNCVAKIRGCAEDVSNDFCSPAVFAYPNLRDAAEACLAKDCADLQACFEAAAKPISDCK